MQAMSETETETDREKHCNSQNPMKTNLKISILYYASPI